MSATLPGCPLCHCYAWPGQPRLSAGETREIADENRTTGSYNAHIRPSYTHSLTCHTHQYKLSRTLELFSRHIQKLRHCDTVSISEGTIAEGDSWLAHDPVAILAFVGCLLIRGLNPLQSISLQSRPRSNAQLPSPFQSRTLQCPHHGLPVRSCRPAHRICSAETS